MAHQPSSLARAEWSTPIVNSTAERDALFPNPVANQRVQNLQTQAFERWIGGWVVDLLYGPSAVPFAPPYIVYPEKHGLSPSNTPAQNTAALNAAYAALPTNTAAILELPAGTLQFDTTGPNGGLRITRSNLTIRGQGIQKTILQYASSTDGTIGPGSVFSIDTTSLSTTPYSNINFEDMTFQDLNPTPMVFSGHGGSAIDLFNVLSFSCRRCEFIDIKGNGCVTASGDSPNPTTPGTGDFIVEDCLFRGTVAGGYIQRDGINCFAMGRLFVRRNRVSGGLGNGSTGGGEGGMVLEGGSGMGEVYFEDNTIDFGGIGLGAVSACTVNRQMRIAGNTFKDWSTTLNASPVNLIADNDTFPQNNIVIENNRFMSAGAPFAAIWIGGAATTNVVVQGNLFECASPVGFGSIPAGVTRISRNTWLWTGTHGNTFVSTGSGSGFVNAADVLEISHNTIQTPNLSGGAYSYVVNFSAWPALKDRRLRGVHTNTLQGPYTGGQIDGITVGQRPAGAAVAQGADSAIITTTVLGAIVGDPVRFFPRYDGYNIPPAGVTFAGTVTAADTVSWYFHNNSGGAVGAGAEIDCMITVERV